LYHLLSTWKPMYKDYQECKQKWEAQQSEQKGEA